MGATITLRNCVGKAVHAFLVGIGPLQGCLDSGVAMLRLKMQSIRMQRRLLCAEEFDEGANPTLVFETVAPIAALVIKFDSDAGVKKTQLAQTAREDVVMEFDVSKDFPAWQKPNFGTGLITGSGRFERLVRNTHAIGLRPKMALTLNYQLEFFRKRVDDRNPDPVQSTGNLVGVVIELAARMQHGHDDLGRGLPLSLVHVDRNTATIVLNTGRAIDVQCHQNAIAMAREGFIDRVVDHLEHHVVEAGAVIGVTDVHARALAYCVQALEHFDTGGRIAVFGHSGFRSE